MDCVLCVCSYPYRLISGERQCVEIWQIDEDYYQLAWMGDDGNSRGADMYGPGAEQRAHDYAKLIQAQWDRDEAVEGWNLRMPTRL